MAELLELADRFGPIAVDLEAACPDCGTAVEGVVVEGADVLCIDCGLPVVA